MRAGKDGAVVGYACVDYKDPVTGKIKEQVKGRNHVFINSFKCDFWDRVLSPVGVPSFFITDDNAPACDGIPYLRGNIIGFGNNSNLNMPAALIRNYVGTLAGGSIPWGESVNNGQMMRFRYVYDFRDDQLLEGIGSFGFTPQYFHRLFILNGMHHLLKPLRERQLVDLGGNMPSAHIQQNVFKMQKNYRASQASGARVHVRDMYSNTPGAQADINVSPHLAHYQPGHVAVGIAFDSSKAYLLNLSDISSNRVLLEFEDDTFSNLLKTYRLPLVDPQNGAYDENSVLRAFAVSGNTAYAFNDQDMIYIDDFTDSAAEWKTVKANRCPLDGIPLGPTPRNFYKGWNRAVTISNGVLYGHGADACPFYDIGAIRQIGNATGIGENVCMEITLEDPMFLHGVRWQYGVLQANPLGFICNQALCCYAMPQDAPLRGPNTSVTIQYTVDVHY